MIVQEVLNRIKQEKFNNSDSERIKSLEIKETSSLNKSFLGHSD